MLGEFKYTDKIRPPIPKKDEKPLMGLQSNKNYIVLNAIDNILAGFIFIFAKNFSAQASKNTN